MADERICPDHQGGKHCWHEFGSPRFKGKYERSVQVECCHCKAMAVQCSHAGEWIEFPGPATAQPK